MMKKIVFKLAALLMLMLVMGVSVNAMGYDEDSERREVMFSLEEENERQINDSQISNSERMKQIAIRVAAIFVIPLVIAFLYVAVLTLKMKSVAMATRATDYIAGNLELTDKTDRFTHMTETRMKMAKNDKK